MGERSQDLEDGNIDLVEPRLWGLLHSPALVVQMLPHFFIPLTGQAYLC